MSNKSKDKVKKILEDFALEIVGDDSIPKLANYLDLSKQTLYGWVESEKIVIKSVKKSVPDVNPRFLRYGDKPIMLNNAPGADRNDINSIDKLLKEERSRLGIANIPDTEQGRVLQDILDDAVSLVLKIRRSIERQKNRAD